MTKIILTIIIGFAGSAIAWLAGLPAAALIGSSLAVSLASLGNLTSTVPPVFRAVAFTIIGCSLGSSVTRELIEQAVHWPLSLCILTVAVVAIYAACGVVLTRFLDQSPETAILAASPGALAYTMSITAEGVGDARFILVIQSIRVLLIITLFPIVLNYFPNGPGVSQPSTAVGSLGPLEFSALMALSIGIGWGLDKIRLPASYLLAGTLASGLAHYFGLVEGRPAGAMLFVGFTITGTIIGSRFSMVSRADLKRLLKASLSVFIVSTGVAAVFAAIVSMLLSMSFGQVFVAYAPGGIEAMAALAIALGYDPAFVASHHLYRLILLFALLPLFLKLSAKIHQT